MSSFGWRATAISISSLQSRERGCADPDHWGSSYCAHGALLIGFKGLNPGAQGCAEEASLGGVFIHGSGGSLGNTVGSGGESVNDGIVPSSVGGLALFGFLPVPAFDSPVASSRMTRQLRNPAFRLVNTLLPA